jgi:hypothetical protein
MRTMFIVLPAGPWINRVLQLAPACSRWLWAIGGVLVAMTLATSGAAQELPTQPHHPTAQSTALSEQPPASTPAPEATSIPLTPAQMPPSAPRVSYEDGQLTIIAENSTLGDILSAVHQLTGAQIDLPSSASGERMAAQVGPGRPREVLTSLLSWTDFNYIIRAADDDPQGVQSVSLLSRSKSSPRNGNPGTTSAWRQRQANRRPVEPTPIAEQDPEPENPVSSQPAETAEGSPGGLQPASADAQPVPATQADLKSAPATRESDANLSLTPSEQMMQGLQRLYEQRRQMQQQQSQKPRSTN